MLSETDIAGERDRYSRRETDIAGERQGGKGEDEEKSTQKGLDIPKLTQVERAR